MCPSESLDDGATIWGISLEVARMLGQYFVEGKQIEANSRVEAARISADGIIKAATIQASAELLAAEPH
jgi:hypothetical protein